MFAAGPRAFGFETDRWTTARLAQAIEGRFAIRYDPDHVGRLMHRLGLRPKPAPALAAEPVRELYAIPSAAFEMQV
jgi:transposase